MKPKTICFYLLAVVLGGCLPLSIHPLYTDDTLVFEEKLLGKWADGDEIWQFTQDSNNSYILRIVDEDGKEGYFNAHLVKLEDMLFMDIFPDGETLRDTQTFYAIHLLPMHTFIKVEQTDPNLVLRMMDLDKVSKILKSDPNLLKHELREGEGDDNAVILTAQTQDLQNFVVEYEDTNSVFGDAKEFSRREPLYTNEDVFFDEHLIGEWQSETGEIFNSIKTQEKSYDIIFLDESCHDTSDNKVCFTANLVNLNGFTLLAVFFGKHNLEVIDPCCLDPDRFVLVEQIEPKLLLQEIDYSEVAQVLKSAECTRSQSEGAHYLFEGLRTTP